jgi:hypothetical protein
MSRYRRPGVSSCISSMRTLASGSTRAPEPSRARIARFVFVVCVCVCVSCRLDAHSSVWLVYVVVELAALVLRSRTSALAQPIARSLVERAARRAATSSDLVCTIDATLVCVCSVDDCRLLLCCNGTAVGTRSASAARRTISKRRAVDARRRTPTSRAGSVLCNAVAANACVCVDCIAVATVLHVVAPLRTEWRAGVAHCAPISRAPHLSRCASRRSPNTFHTRRSLLSFAAAIVCRCTLLQRRCV